MALATTVMPFFTDRSARSRDGWHEEPLPVTARVDVLQDDRGAQPGRDRIGPLGGSPSVRMAAHV
jgi:hypothetical protein